MADPPKAPFLPGHRPIGLLMLPFGLMMVSIG
jgi:hypothetical protein